MIKTYMRTLHRTGERLLLHSFAFMFSKLSIGGATLSLESTCLQHQPFITSAFSLRLFWSSLTSFSLEDKLMTRRPRLSSGKRRSFKRKLDYKRRPTELSKRKLMTRNSPLLESRKAKSNEQNLLFDRTIKK